MLEVKAPAPLKKLKDSKTVFMAGSIDMGTAVDWQKELRNAFEKDKRVTFWNPRRDDWDSTWEQDASFAPFKEQVLWELKALNKADIIVFYFDPKGKAPITLLELGLFAGSGIGNNEAKPLIVCCPDGYYKKGNVDITCDYYGVPIVDSLEELIKGLDALLNE